MAHAKNLPYLPVLIRYFPDVMDIKFTADMEDKLDGIEDGGKRWQDVIDEFYDGFEDKIERAVNLRAKSSVPVGEYVTTISAYRDVRRYSTVIPECTPPSTSRTRIRTTIRRVGHLARQKPVVYQVIELILVLVEMRFHALGLAVERYRADSLVRVLRALFGRVITARDACSR